MKTSSKSKLRVFNPKEVYLIRGDASGDAVTLAYKK